MADDSELLQDIKRMDEEALAKVFDLYAHAIYKYAFRHCSNAVIADQIVGDVFAKLLEKLKLGNGPTSNIRSYLFEMAYHAMVDEIRRSRRTTPIANIEFLQQEPNYPDTTAEDRVLLEIVVRMIQRDLSDDQRHVILLRFMEGFSLKETAKIMGKKVGNIKVIQSRAVAGLRKALDTQWMNREYIEFSAIYQ
jgi:RNA polymerase sigma-70 factor (ECF subfamily)